MERLRATTALFWLAVISLATTLVKADVADPLDALGIEEHRGATAGYVADKHCRICHADLFDSYQHVGMAQSFAKPGDAKWVEDFGKEFFHEPSQRYYQIRKEGRRLIFSRYLRDDQNQPVLRFEVEIDWILGSGNRARSYLYQTDWGELYELPLGWYSEISQWGMSPGFENGDHKGVLRDVRRECMFCHNAYPTAQSGSDQYWQPHRFPHDLPQGTGCQRCHGPGAEHIRAALGGKPPTQIKDNITNPAKLGHQQRDSVCFQCHMLPAVSIVGSRRVDRADYSFRPGELLSDYIMHVIPEETTPKQNDGFEINHHGYRFWQSRCVQESDGELGCISCHNPHVKPDRKSFRKKVADVCTDCHAEVQKKHAKVDALSDECVSCHMPTRRTRDVVQVTMTDHKISRGPFDREKLVQPIEKKAPVIDNVQLLPFGLSPDSENNELYRIMPIAKLQPKNNTNAFHNWLRDNPSNSPTPYLILAKSWVKLNKPSKVMTVLKSLIGQRSALAPAYATLGLAFYRQNNLAEGVALFEKSLASAKTPEGYYNLALGYAAQNQYAQALVNLDNALALRPNMYRAFWYKARIFSKQGKLDTAKHSFLQSLRLEPGFEKAYVGLVKTLRSLGQAEEATRYLRLGMRVAKTTEELATALDPLPQP